MVGQNIPDHFVSGLIPSYWVILRSLWQGFGARLGARVDRRYGAVTTLTSIMLGERAFARGVLGALRITQISLFSSRGLTFVHAS